jgi:hypothetical protein
MRRKLGFRTGEGARAKVFIVTILLPASRPRIPPSQRDRVIYLDTTDPAQPYGYNPLRSRPAPPTADQVCQSSRAGRHGSHCCDTVAMVGCGYGSFRLIG